MTSYAHKNTLGAAEAAAEVVTSLLGRQVTNELEHIVLALEMSRGVKMSPQIAPGHQMSPFHSTPHPSLLPTLFMFSLFLIFFFFFFLCTSFRLLASIYHRPLVLSVLFCYPLTIRQHFLFIASKGQRGEEN